MPATKRAVPDVPEPARAEVHAGAAGALPRPGLLRPRGVRVAAPAGGGRRDGRLARAVRRARSQLQVRRGIWELIDVFL